MPRFAFGKRKSAIEGENDAATPSFRVLDRTEVADGNVGRSFDGGARLSAKTHVLPRTTVADVSSYDDNIFSEFKPNTHRYVVSCFLHSSGLARLWCQGLCQFPTRSAGLGHPGNSCLDFSTELASRAPPNMEPVGGYGADSFR